MGLFSDKCQALVDPKTGLALRGEALEAARANPKAPRCGHRVSKKARGCSKCGSPAPGGWWQCPGCGKWVGNESNFCPHCFQPLHVASRGALRGGVWQKQPGVFAEKAEVGDVRRLLGNGLVVETGTAAILLDAGRFRDVLEAGRHTLESLARKINHWGDPPPRTVVLVETGDAVIPLRFEALRSAEEIPVELFTELCFRFREKGAERFVANVLKEKPCVTYADLTALLEGSLRYAVGNVVHTTTVEDLVKHPQRRLAVEDAMQAALKEALESAGLELDRLGAVDFTGEEYEALREKAGGLEVARRNVELDQRLRELVASDKMQQLRTEEELEAYVRQLAQERDVSSLHLEQELTLLKQVQRQELEKQEAQYRMACEMEKAAHQIGFKLKWDAYTDERLLKDAKLKDEIARIQVAREIQEALDWLKVRAEKIRIKLDKQRAKAEIEARALRDRADTLKGRSLQELIALVRDERQREHLLEMNRQMLQAGMSPEQILAAAAGDSPQAADALARMRELKREDLDRDFRDRRQVADEAAARLERVMADALKSMAEFARHGGSTQTINKLD